MMNLSKKKFFLFLLLILSLAVFTACSQEEGIENKLIKEMDIIIKVIDEENNSLENVTVILSDENDEEYVEQTDQEGLAVFEKIKMVEGKGYDITLNKDGYSELKEKFIAGDNPLEFQLEKIGPGTAEKVKISGNIITDFDHFSAVDNKIESTIIQSISQSSSYNNKIENEKIIAFVRNLSKEEKEKIIAELDGELIRYLENSNAAVIKVAESTNDIEVAALSNNKVRYIEPHYQAHTTAFAKTNDQLYSSQWNYPMLDLEYVWQESTGKNIRIAVLDTGLAVDHSEFKNNERIDLENAYNFIDYNRNINDDHGHGTHVTGIIAASTNNNNGISAASWETEVLPLKVLDKDGNGGYASIAEAVRYAAGLSEDPVNPEPVDIINLSLGGGSDSQIMKDAISEAAANGVIVVASAGNDGKDNKILYPAQYSKTITVTSVTNSGQHASYSNYDKSLTVDDENLVVSAPGGSIYYGVLSTYLDEQYANLAGTSMAAPHISAIISLMLDNGISKSEIRETIKNNSVHSGEDKFSPQLGYGILNANFAVNNTSQIKVVLGKRRGNTIETTAVKNIPLSGGEYIFEDIDPGEYSVYAWIDVKDDKLINSGDYLKESNRINFVSGKEYRQDLTISTPANRY